MCNKLMTITIDGIFSEIVDIFKMITSFLKTEKFIEKSKIDTKQKLISKLYIIIVKIEKNTRFPLP